MEKPLDEGIGIDLDDTIANSSEHVLDMIKKRYDPNARIEDWNQFDVTACFNITKEQSIRLFTEVWSKPEEIELVDERIPEIISKLSSAYKVFLLTATVGSRRFYEPWLEGHNIKFDGIIRVQRSIEKITTGSSFGINYYIDDHELVAKSVASAGKKAILIKRPWNADFADSVTDKNIRVVRSWEEIERLFSSPYRKI
jgi:5'(3')-deoxyribonucleotidase